MDENEKRKLQEELVSSALMYARRGWYVFPTREEDSSYIDSKTGKLRHLRAKSPYEMGGLHTATVDEKKILRMWEAHPLAGIGLNCGKSNILVVDIDTHGKDKGGLEQFVSMGIPFRDTLQSLTPSGGLHILYEGFGRTTSNEKLQIDTRGAGGYIILPPSVIIRDGVSKPYLWMKEPSNDCLVPVPDELRDQLLEKKYNKRRTTGRTGGGKTYGDDVFAKAERIMSNLPVSLAHDYSDWVRVGMSLRGFGDKGFELWESWTDKYFSEKPDSKRKNSLEYKWDTFDGTEVGVGTLFYYAKSEGLL